MGRSERPILMAPTEERIVISQSNFMKHVKPAYKPKGESLTIPDQSFSIEEILEKWTQGIDPMLTKIGHGFDESEVEFDDIPANYSPDLTELDEDKKFIEELEIKKKKIKLKKEEKKEEDKAEKT